MRYMLLICSDDKAAPPAPRAEMEAIVQGHRRFSEELEAAGKAVVGGGLRPARGAGGGPPRLPAPSRGRGPPGWIAWAPPAGPGRAPRRSPTRPCSARWTR